MNPIANAAVAVSLLAAPAVSLASGWDFDTSHSNASFAVRHLMVSNVRGEFAKVTGAVELDEKDVTKSTVNASIHAASINTRDPKRDEHLRSPDFFDVAKYPALTFQSKKVEKAGENKLKISGALSIRGTTKDVVLDAEFTPEIKNPWGMVVRGVTATTTINRKDFGLSWNKDLEAGGVLVGDEVKITLDVELVKRAPKKS